MVLANNAPNMNPQLKQRVLCAKLQPAQINRDLTNLVHVLVAQLMREPKKMDLHAELTHVVNLKHSSPPVSASFVDVTLNSTNLQKNVTDAHSCKPVITTVDVAEENNLIVNLKVCASSIRTNALPAKNVLHIKDMTHHQCLVLTNQKLIVIASQKYQKMDSAVVHAHLSISRILQTQINALDKAALDQETS